MIKNPILKGFNPDPCICRKGDDYFIAVSSFEWFPGIPIYHSKDLKNWELKTHVLTDDKIVDLKRLPSAKGVWAPSLTYCEADGLFYVLYSVMNSMNARYFDVDNYLITAPDITGPWSEPVYLHSAGFDASILHDKCGKKWVVSLEWETREGYEKPGAICLVEYSPEERSIVGYPKRIWSGGTDRGCIEAPHLTRRGDYYYIMCAEGGTGYGHCVTMGRSKKIMGPYEKDPENPIVTSVPGNFYERHDPDHLKPKYFNPKSKLQKSGHGSYVETPTGEVYLVHLCSRPFLPELRCTLGRETAMQKMHWVDGWLRLVGEDNIAKEYFEPSLLPKYPVSEVPSFDNFDTGELGLQYYAPRISPLSFTSMINNQLMLRGQESLCSLHKSSIIARKLTSVYTTLTTKMIFKPEVYQHSAGLVLYYDNMNYIYLQKFYDESIDASSISIICLENGEKTESSSITVSDDAIYLRLVIKGKFAQFKWSEDGINYWEISKAFDTTKISDEYCKYGEFTGAFVGIACVDSLLHKHCATFDFLDYQADEEKDVE